MSINIIKNFVERLNEEKLLFILDRSKDNLQDDMFEILSFFEKDKDMDKVLSSACDSEDFYYAIDDIKKCCDLEIRKRNIAV